MPKRKFKVGDIVNYSIHPAPLEIIEFYRIRIFPDLKPRTMIHLKDFAGHCYRWDYSLAKDSLTLNHEYTTKKEITQWLNE